MGVTVERDGDRVTAAEFAAQVTDVAKGLIEAGDRVAIMSRTRYEWALLDFAAWAAGAVVVPVYPAASAEQAAWAIRDSGVTAIVISQCIVVGDDRPFVAVLEAYRADIDALYT